MKIFDMSCFFFLGILVHLVIDMRVEMKWRGKHEKESCQIP